MLVGYARVSSSDQNLDLQTNSLKTDGCVKIFTDKISGSSKTRPGLEAALSYLREDDTLVVWKLDRLGRTLKGLIELTEQLKKNGYAF